MSETKKIAIIVHPGTYDKLYSVFIFTCVSVVISFLNITRDANIQLFM